MILTIHKVLQDGELEQINIGLAKAEFKDGRATASGAAARAKNNLQLGAGDKAHRSLQKIVIDALQRNEAFSTYAMPLRMLPPMFNRYDVGMGYGDHVDRPVMSGPMPTRTDLALTVFLSDPASYDGGELVVSSDFGPQKVKLPAGSMVLYSASTLHRVEPVIRGSRLAAVSWVQCMVREAERRQIASELGQIRRWIENQSPDAAQGLQLQKIRAQLIRMWSEV